MGKPSTSQSSSTFVLYRFYTADDTLLYVGLTRDPGRRLAKHAGEKSWWDDVARVEFTHFDNLQDLRSAEREAISTEKPLHNIHMNGTRTTRKPVATDPIETVEIDGLVGRYFHTFRDLGDPEKDQYATIMNGRALVWQGRVLEQISDELYMIETYSWWDGCSVGDQLARIDEMVHWRFYDTSLEMQVALPCGESHGAGDSCQGEREFYHHMGGGLGIHFICNGCRKRYPGFAEYTPIVWRDGKPHLK